MTQMNADRDKSITDFPSASSALSAVNISMTTRTKIYLIAAAVAMIVTGILAGAAWSEYRLSKLEAEIDGARTRADTMTTAADEAERRASQYAAKIEYLETTLAGIQAIAQKQDEELQKLNTDTRTARSRVDAARRVRTVTATADQLCQKLAEVGHGC